MDKVIINNIPSVNRKDFGYKAINRSDTHNSNQEEVLNDILDLFNKTNAVERVINEQLDYIKLENSYLESANKAMLDKFEDLYQKFQDFLTGERYRRCIIMPQDCTTYDEIFGAIVDNLTSDITVRPSKKISKFVITDSITDSVFLPDTLEVTINDVTSKGIISKVNHDIYAPFYKDNNLYWTRTVVTDNTAESVITEYIINLPEEIMTTPEMNEIFINPFLCKVKEVYGRYGDSNVWELIKGQEYHDAINNEKTIEAYINSNRPFRLSFPNTKINQIKIVVEASQYIEGETNLRTFNYGIKQISGYINYYNSYEANSFQFDVTIPEIESHILITGIVPYFNNGSESSAYSRDFVCDVYYKDEAGYYHKIIDTYPFTPPTNKIRVKCKFGENLGVSNIKKIEVRYKMPLQYEL